MKTLKRGDRLTIGIISDTHGTLPEKAIEALAGVQVILHAGDIGSEEVIGQLERIAPVIAVRGNMDGGPWCQDRAITEAVELGGIGVYLLHDIHHLDLDPAAGGFSLVVSGHTHRAVAIEQNGVLFLNPGSAAYPRHGSPPGIARVTIENGKLTHRLVSLE
ncbi:MAG: metallophosphoesterase [Desulfobacterales bacterium]|nr:metallophosphoesterase [Desulfobacterales bacterium]